MVVQPLELLLASNPTYAQENKRLSFASRWLIVFVSLCRAACGSRVLLLQCLGGDGYEMHSLPPPPVELFDARESSPHTTPIQPSLRRSSYTMASQETLDSPDHCTVSWITALPIERATAVAMLDEEHAQPTGFKTNSADTIVYTWGSMGKHNLVMASLAACGTISAATTLSSLAFLPSIDEDRDNHWGNIFVSSNPMARPAVSARVTWLTMAVDSVSKDSMRQKCEGDLLRRSSVRSTGSMWGRRRTVVLEDVNAAQQRPARQRHPPVGAESEGAYSRLGHAGQGEEPSRMIAASTFLRWASLSPSCHAAKALGSSVGACADPTSAKGGKRLQLTAARRRMRVEIVQVGMLEDKAAGIGADAKDWCA